MPTYKELNKLNPKIDLNNIIETKYLYCGGEAICKNASYFIKQAAGESPQQYKDRLDLLSYKNYFGQIVDSITSKIFEQEVKVLAEEDSEDMWFSEFQDENDLTEILRDLTTNCLLHTCGYLHINYLEDGDQRQLPKLCVIPNDTIINYKKCAETLHEIIIKTLEEDEKISCLIPDRFYYKFVHYILDGDKVICNTYKTEIFKINAQAPKPNQLFGLSALGAGAKFQDNKAQDERKDYKIVSSESVTLDIPKIPVLELKLKHGLSLGNKLGPIAKEILEDYSQLRSFMHQTLHPIAVLNAAGISDKDEFNDAFGSEDRDRSPLEAYKSKGFSKIMRDDKLSYLEAKADVGKLVFEHIEKLHSDMYMLSWQTIIAPKQAVQKSGVAKGLDEKQKDIIISTISTKLKRYLDDVMTQILSILGKENVDLSIMGLDFSSDHIDRESVLQEALLVQSLGVLNDSKTFTQHYFLNTAEVLLSGQSDKELIEQISEELEENIAKKQDHDSKLKEQLFAGKDSNLYGTGTEFSKEPPNDKKDEKDNVKEDK